jgi:hypothetical protein
MQRMQDPGAKVRSAPRARKSWVPSQPVTCGTGAERGLAKRYKKMKLEKSSRGLARRRFRDYTDAEVNLHT